MFSPGVGQRLSVISRDPIAREFDGFIIDCQARALSPRTIELYQDKFSYWRQLFKSMGVTDVASITPLHLRRGLVELAKTHNPGGVHVCYRVLKTFLRWLVAEGVLEKNPIERIKPPKVPQEPLEPVPLTDVKAMLATCDKTFTGERDRAILLCLLDTGCRASEFVALNIGDVNLANGAVMIRQAKGGKFRTAFLGNKARRAMVRYLRYQGNPGSDAPLWVTDEGTRFTYWGLRHVIRRRAERAEVPVPCLHSFRRAFALLSLRGGMDIFSLQRLMGHADLSTLRRYLAQTEDDLADAHRRAGPVDHLL